MSDVKDIRYEHHSGDEVAKYTAPLEPDLITTKEGLECEDVLRGFSAGGHGRLCVPLSWVIALDMLGVDRKLYLVEPLPAYLRKLAKRRAGGT